MRTPSVSTQILWIAISASIAISCLGTNSDLERPLPLVAAVLGALAASASHLAVTRPRAAILLNGAAVGCYFGVGFADSPIFFTIALTAFVAGLSLRPQQQMPVQAAGLAMFVAGLLARYLVDHRSWVETGWQGFANALLALGAAAAGWWWQGREDARRERASRVATEEQLRMARDLHDGVGHGLAVIAMQAGVGLHVLDSDPEAARRALLAIREASTESLGALRSELSLLTGKGDDASAAESAPRRPTRGLADLPALVERVRATGLEVDLSVEGSPESVPAQAHSAAYAIVQEALTNVLKHSGASHAQVRVHVGDDMSITVKDNGSGEPALVPGDGVKDGAGQGNSLGLAGMRARVLGVGGSLKAGPEVGGGFCVRAEIPAREGANP